MNGSQHSNPRRSRIDRWWRDLCARRLGPSPAYKLDRASAAPCLPQPRRWGTMVRGWMSIALVAIPAAIVLLAANAGAVELISDPCYSMSCGYVVAQPQPVVIYQPQPVVQYVTTTPVVVVEHDPVVVQVEDEVKPVKERKLSWLGLKAGAGMWIIPGLKEDVHLGYNAGIALALKGFYTGLDFTWIHGMKWVDEHAEEPCVEGGNLALIALDLGYRFNKDGRVHPVLAANFDTLVLDREKAGTKLAFGIGASLGLDVDFPLSFGAIVVGLKVGGQRHVWSQNGFYPPRSSASVIGSLGYRF